MLRWSPLVRLSDRVLDVAQALEGAALKLSALSRTCSCVFPVSLPSASSSLPRALLSVPLTSYIGAALFARPDWACVLGGTLIPTIRLDPGRIAILVALLGMTISPYLFFWHASQEVEEQISIGRRHLRQREGASVFEPKYALWDMSRAGLLGSGGVLHQPRRRRPRGDDDSRVIRSPTPESVGRLCRHRLRQAPVIPGNGHRRDHTRPGRQQRGRARGEGRAADYDVVNEDHRPSGDP